MTREEIIEAIQHDNMMPFLQDWEVRDVVDFVLKNIQPSFPDNLKEAASKYISTYYANHHREPDMTSLFIAGAEYQRKQDQQLIELAEDHAMLAGMNKMKEEMMEKAVEGKVFMSFAPGHNQMVMADVDLPTNTKVRVIVIPEESEKVK